MIRPVGRSVSNHVPSGREAKQPLTPGQAPVILAGLTIGIALMGIQLWLLTVALDLYLSGEGAQIAGLTLASGIIFVGGIFMLRLIRRRLRVKVPFPDVEAPVD
jgi:peptidoglycan biosynthesis protein MviN/MurJ (putative lipid II flippase)